MGFLWVLTVTAAVAGASSAGGLRAASGGDDGDGGRHLAAKPKKETSSKVCKGGKEKGTCEDLGCQWNKCAPWASKKKGKNKKKKGKAKKISSPTASPTVDEHDSAGEHDFVITGKLRLGDFNSESTEDTVAFMNLVAPFASDGDLVVTVEESAVRRNGQVSFDMVFSLGSSITGGLTSLLQETALQFLGDAAATLVNFAGTTTAFGEILRRFLRSCRRQIRASYLRVLGGPTTRRVKCSLPTGLFSGTLDFPSHSAHSLHWHLYLRRRTKRRSKGATPKMERSHALAGRWEALRDHLPAHARVRTREARAAAFADGELRRRLVFRGFDLLLVGLDELDLVRRRGDEEDQQPASAHHHHRV